MLWSIDQLWLLDLLQLWGWFYQRGLLDHIHFNWKQHPTALILNWLDFAPIILSLNFVYKRWWLRLRKRPPGNYRSSILTKDQNNSFSYKGFLEMHERTIRNLHRLQSWYGLIRVGTGWCWLIWVDTGWYGLIRVDMGWYRLIRVDSGWFRLIPVDSNWNGLIQVD